MTQELAAEPTTCEERLTAAGADGTVASKYAESKETMAVLD